MSSETRSELQQIASRTNGAKSHGPVTEEGKQASSQNSRRHGLLSKKVVLEGESQEEFDALLASYLEEHQPRSPTEATLIENMAVARWRQQRVWSLETAAFDHQIRRPKYMEGDDFPTQAFVAFRTLTDEGRSLDLLNRYDTRFERQFRAALTTLLNLQAKRAASRATEVRINAARASRQTEPDSPADGPDAAPNRFILYWVDEEGNKTLAADSGPNDPEPEPDEEKEHDEKEDGLPPAAPGSFGNSVSRGNSGFSGDPGSFWKSPKHGASPTAAARCGSQLASSPGTGPGTRKSVLSNSRQYMPKAFPKPFESCNFGGPFVAPFLEQYSLQRERL